MNRFDFGAVFSFSVAFYDPVESGVQ